MQQLLSLDRRHLNIVTLLYNELYSIKNFKNKEKRGCNQSPQSQVLGIPYLKQVFSI